MSVIPGAHFKRLRALEMKVIFDQQFPESRSETAQPLAKQEISGDWSHQSGFGASFWGRIPDSVPGHRVNGKNWP